jgi:hypothetical protein
LRRGPRLRSGPGWFRTGCLRSAWFRPGCGLGRASLLFWPCLRCGRSRRCWSRTSLWPGWLRSFLRSLGRLRCGSSGGGRRPCLGPGFGPCRLWLRSGLLGLLYLRLASRWLPRTVLRIWPVWLIHRAGPLAVRQRLRSSRSLLLSRPVGLLGDRLTAFRCSHRAHHRRRLDITIRLHRPRSYKLCGASTVHRSKLRAVGRGSLSQLQLSGHWRRMRCAICGYFSRQWTCPNPLRSAVIAGVVVVDDRGVVDHHFPLIHIGDVHVGDVGYGAIVVEVIIVPVSTLVTAADIAKAIVHAAVEADITAPVAVVKSVSATEESPVTWRPQRALIGRLRPGTRDPIVSLVRVSPVARRPEVAGGGDWRLLIIRQRRRRLRCVVSRLRIVVRIAILLIATLIPGISGSLVIAGIWLRLRIRRLWRRR